MNIYQTQSEWDNLNQSLCNLFGVDYTPSIVEPILVENHTQSATGLLCEQLNMKNWIVTHIPTNIENHIRNLAEFCRNNGLNENKMRAVAKGQRNSHRGWKVLERA